MPFPVNASADETGGHGAISWDQDSALSQLDPSAFDLVTLDVFDTLLLRRCGPPEAVFERVAQAARSAALLDPSVTDDAFVIMRRQAEARARSQSGDVDLAAIYRALELHDTDTAALERLERRVERAMAIANPYMLSLLGHLQEQGTPVLLISDMYLGGAEIRGMLESVGIAAGRNYERLHVSCDHGASKAGGVLFRMILAQHPGLRPDRVLHIGDDPVTDKAGAAAAGIRALHYTLPGWLNEMVRRETLLGTLPRGPLVPARGLAARGVRARDGNGFWYGYGATVLGPVAVHYASWVVRDAAARGIRRIAPLMREGELLGQLMVLEAERLGLDVIIAPLAVSRAALYLPSLIRFDEAELRSLATEIFRTLRDVLTMLDLGPLPDSLLEHADTPLVDLLGAEFGEAAKGWQAAKVYLLSEETVGRIHARAQQARRDFVAYMKEQFGATGQVALVDIGAKGSMFERFARLPELTGHYDFHGYLFYATPAVLHRVVGGVRIRTHMPQSKAAFEQAKVIYRSPQFLELLLNGEAATTISYRRDERGRIRPIQEPPKIDSEQRGALRACRAGILSYQAQWARLADGEDAPDRDTDPEALLGILHRAVHLPTGEEARRIGRLVYDVNNGSSARLRICSDRAGGVLDTVITSTPPSLWLSLSLQTRPSDVPWPQGQMTLCRAGHIEEMLDGAQGGFGHRAISRQLVHMVRNAGIDRYILCAAGGMGGMGPTFLDVARDAGLECVGYADLLATGEGFAQTAELTMTEAAKLECRDIVVVSVGYGQAILAALDKGRKEDGRPLRCWWYDGTRFRDDRLGDALVPAQRP
ncbi:HAD family hydrolase [Azospirillum himalayense]|uniref:HAD family hydrolase n=1 Tax=Azospirillum himalayense TaxID=654847 RepID=A0ABW0G127_9PROT